MHDAGSKSHDKKAMSAITGDIAVPAGAVAADAISILVEDRMRIERLFDALQSIRDCESKSTLVREICRQLRIHTQVAEEVFYPAAGAITGDLELCAEADLRLTFGKQLASELDAMSPAESAYDVRVALLGKYLRRVAEHERSGLFARVARSGLDLNALGHQIRERKEELWRRQQNAARPAPVAAAHTFSILPRNDNEP